MAAIQVDVVGETDIGLVRERNEDAFIILDISKTEHHDVGQHHLVVGEGGVVLSVLDGMGGAAAGDHASRLAAEVFGDYIMTSRVTSRPALLTTMIAAAQEANSRIRAAGEADRKLLGMGTTLTAAALLDSHLLVVHVGDSRAYVWRGGCLVQITEDQSLIRELVATGQIQQDEAALYEHNNVILQALGVTDELQPFAAEIPLQRGDLLMLCTDGLTTMVPREEIVEVLATKGATLDAAARALTALARAHGGHDNVTLVLARFEGDALPVSQETASGSSADVEIRGLAAPVSRRRDTLSPVALVILALLVIAAVAGIILLVGTD